MPIVLHKFDIKTVKRMLEDSFSLSFENSFLYENEMLHEIQCICQDVEVFKGIRIDEKKKIFTKLMDKVYSDCVKALPSDCCNYGLGEVRFVEDANDLLNYVLMDTFLNVEHSILSKCSTADLQYNDLISFYRKHFIYENLDKNFTKYEKSNALKKPYSNFTTALKNASTIPFIANHFLVPEKDQIENMKTRSNSIPVYKNFENINGILISYIGKNPYYSTNIDKISSDTLCVFFQDYIYENIKKTGEPVNSKYVILDLDFSYNNDLEYIKALYYFDVYYDWLNNLCVATKLSKYEKKYNISKNEKKSIIDVFARCMLIPDIFHKEIYTDTIFELLFDNNCRYVRKQKILDNSVIEKILAEEMFNTNISLCYEYIAYVSKVFLPVISSYFYVVLSELLNDEEKLYEILKVLVVEIVGEYYDSYKEKLDEIFSFRRKFKKEFEHLDDYTKEFKDRLKDGIEDNLCPLYESIRTDIFSDSSKYDKILEELSLF